MGGVICPPLTPDGGPSIFDSGEVGILRRFGVTRGSAMGPKLSRAVPVATVHTQRRVVPNTTLCMHGGYNIDGPLH